VRNRAPFGPTTSNECDIGIAPRRLTRPFVGTRPTTPETAAGQRIEPPVSEPNDAWTMRPPTATPEPLDEPQGMYCGFHGLRHCG
jgi:hypothetical protein